MLNSFLVMKKPIGVSGLLSNLGHHSFRSSEVLSSPTVVLKRGAGTSAFFNSLRSFPTRTIQTTPALTIVSTHDDEDDERDVFKDSDTHHGERDIIFCAYSRQHGECRCHVREDDDAVYLTCEMPEVDKKDVKITVENNKLIVKGERQERIDDNDDDEKNLKYCCTFKLELALLKINEIKAEMKDGLVEVVLPKMKVEKRNDIIHHVKVD